MALNHRCLMRGLAGRREQHPARALLPNWAGVVVHLPRFLLAKVFGFRKVTFRVRTNAVNSDPEDLIGELPDCGCGSLSVQQFSMTRIWGSKAKAGRSLKCGREENGSKRVSFLG